MTLNSILTEAIQIIKPVLSGRVQSSEKFPVQFTFRLALERVYFSLESLHFLLSSQSVNHDHALGLIARNLLSDYLIISYLLKRYSDPMEREKLLYSLYHDDLDKVERTMKRYLKEGFISKKDFETYTTNYSEGIYSEVKEYRELNAGEKFPSIADIAEWALKNREKDSRAMEMVAAYDTWIYYSKYEHIGWHSYAFTRDSKISHRQNQKWLLPILSKALVTAASATLQLGDSNSSDLLMNLLSRITEVKPLSRE